MGKATESGLSPSKRKWLAHLQACAESGLAMRRYAQRKGLSEHSLYQAAKELRKLGAWGSAAQGRGKPPLATASSRFVRVEAPVRSEPEHSWRIQLSNGVSLEGSAELSAEQLPALLAALAAL